jgi:hypothetical protein
MSAEWFYKLLDDEIGPVSARELLSLAQNGTLHTSTEVRKGQKGKWVAAQRVKGLFAVAGISSGEALSHTSAHSPRNQPLPPPIPKELDHQSSSNKKCPYCGEQVLAVAIKCRFCGANLVSGNVYWWKNKTRIIVACLAVLLLMCGAWMWIASRVRHAQILKDAQEEYSRTSTRLAELKKAFNDIQPLARTDSDRYWNLMTKIGDEQTDVTHRWMHAMAVIDEEGGKLP